jgi:hypothetical protein
MSFGATALIGCFFIIAFGIAVTHPEELRGHRWLKIILSIPVVLVIASAVHELNAINAYFSAFSFAVLAFIWRSPIAHFFSLVFMRLLNGDMNRPTGIRAEFGAAKRLHIHGDLDDALKHTRRELEKDPFNYEGLLLLAQIYIDIDEPLNAVKTLNLALCKSTLTPEQRIAVLAAKQSLEANLRVAELNSK